MRESGNNGSTQRHQKKKICQWVTNHLWMSSENCFWSDHGVLIEQWHKQENTYMIH